MKRNRRSFLKAALGCAAALVVPGALPSVIPKPPAIFKPTARENAAIWYKPGIWAMPKPIDAKLLEGSIIVFETKQHVHLKFDNRIWKDKPWQEWKGAPFSKPFLER